MLVVAVLVGLLAWPSLLRAVRAQVLSLKEREFIEAARSLDLSLGHIVFNELLPNMRSYIAISFILAMTQAIYTQAGLIFLGIVPLSGSNWGLMINLAWTRGAIFFRDSLPYIMSPVLAIALFQLSLVSRASALEDIFNPRLRGVGGSRRIPSWRYATCRSTTPPDAAPCMPYATSRSTSDGVRRWRSSARAARAKPPWRSASSDSRPARLV
jgi:hypothetical protein